MPAIPTSFVHFTAAPIRGLRDRKFFMLNTEHGSLPRLVFANETSAIQVANALTAMKLSPVQVMGLLVDPIGLRHLLDQLLQQENVSAVSEEVGRLLQSLQVIGWSQAKLAKKLQIYPNTISRWVAGRTPVPGWVLEYLNALKAVKELSNSLDL